MNVLLVALGSHGDVHPVLGVGAALAARGHQVTVVTNPHFAALVERVGLRFEPIGTEESLQAAMEDPDLWHPTRSLRLVAGALMLPLMRPLFEIVSRHQAGGSAVVVAPGTGLGARIAQEKLGVSLVTFHLQPSMLRSMHDTPALSGMLTGPRVPRFVKQAEYWLADKLVVDRLLAGEVNAFRAELGLRPVRRIFAEWMHSPQRVIGLFPDWFAPLQPDWPARTVATGFPLWDERDVTVLPDEVEQFLAAGDRPIVFTPGSAMMHGREFFAAAAAACGQLGQRGILLTRHKGQVPANLPSSVRHFEFVPFSALLPRAAAVVHHGGIGSCAQGLAAGVPQLVMPMAHDQPDNARRLVRLGVARTIRRRRFSGPAAAGALAGLIESAQVAERCRAIARRFDTAAEMARTCALIEAEAH